MSSNGQAAGSMGHPAVKAGYALVDKAADFANYFCTYAFLYHQKEMLSDRFRMDAYYNAIFRNARHFQGKTVLDVGTGSGILAIWCAKAGASKVYAVEATNMAEHARSLVAGNGVSHVVEVIQGSIEDVKLPEQVDIIISEWMGYFLLRESMFDSVISARDRWLKPTGMMYPSHARMWLAPIRTSLGDQKLQEYQGAMADWKGFMQDTKEHYGVDMHVLADPYREEQQKYFLQTSLWNSLYPNQVIGQPALVKEIDCLTASLEDVSSVRCSFSMPLTGGHRKLCGFAGWFDVTFRGGPNDAADHEVQLTTAPSVDGTTHWGQQVFLLHPPKAIAEQDRVEGSLEMTRSGDNHRLMDVKLTHRIESPSSGRHGEMPSPNVSLFYIE